MNDAERLVRVEEIVAKFSGSPAGKADRIRFAMGSATPVLERIASDAESARRSAAAARDLVEDHRPVVIALAIPGETGPGAVVTANEAEALARLSRAAAAFCGRLREGGDGSDVGKAFEDTLLDGEAPFGYVLDAEITKARTGCTHGLFDQRYSDCECALVRIGLMLLRGFLRRAAMSAGADGAAEAWTALPCD